MSFPTQTLKGLKEKKTAFELCDVVFALSIFPEASLQLQEEAKGERGDTSLLQSLICLTPSHPPFTPSPWRKRAARRGPGEFTSFSQLGHVIIYLLGAFHSLLPRERWGRCKDKYVCLLEAGNLYPV